MSAQVTNNSFTNIGRMFARQNVPILYDMKKSADAAEPDAPPESVDRVSLSSSAPRPLSAGFFEDAVGVGRVIGSGGKLSGGQVARLREDRVFQAVSMLAAMGDGDNAVASNSWPAGLPFVNKDEMEEARRRVAQRLGDMDTAGNPDAVQKTRMELLQKIGKRDFSEFASREGEGVLAASGSAA